MSTQVIILAAGKGSRMGIDGPKVLVPLAGKHLICHLLDQLKALPELGVPIIVVGYKHTAVKTALGSGYTYVLQEQQLGSGHAVLCAQSAVRAENVLVLYADMPLVKSLSIKKLLRLHLGQQAVLSMFTTRVPQYDSAHQGFYHFGRIIRDRFNNIIAIREFKESSEAEKQITEVNPGIYLFNGAWLYGNIHQLQNTNAQEEYYLTDMVTLAIEQGLVVQSLPIGLKEACGVNTPGDLARAEWII